MQDTISLLLGYIRGAWRYRWLAMAVPWIVAPVGWFFVYEIPDRYEASARVYVDTRTILRPLLKGLAIQSDVSQQLNLMTRLLLSRKNLEQVARMTDLDLNVKTPNQMDSLIQTLSKKITITGDNSRGRKSDNIYTIACEHPDPQMAKRIVQSLLTLFVETALGETRKDSDSAQRFLEKQIAAYQARLEEAELQRKKFKRDNFGLLPGQGSDSYAELEMAAAQVEEARLLLREAEQRRDELRRQLEDEEDDDAYDLFAGIGPQTAFSTKYDDRIEVLQTNLDDLLMKYTKRHPTIITIKETLDELEARREVELEELQKNAPLEEGLPAGDRTSPVFQQIKLTLGEAEANVASMRARVQEYERRLGVLQERVDAGLEVETKLKGLNRDYQIIKANYNGLIAKRETAKLSEQVEQRADNVKFKIIDPPRLPNKPATPNRPLLISLVLLGGLAAGLGFAVLTSLIRPTFDDRRSLNDETGLPVLGSVSMNWTPEQKVKRKLQFVAYVLTGVSLLAIYGGVLAVQVLDINVGKYIEHAPGVSS